MANGNLDVSRGGDSHGCPDQKDVDRHAGRPAVAIVLAAIDALTEGRLDPIDPLQPGNTGITGYWIGNLGWIPFIAGLVAMFAGFRRSGVGVSLASLFGALAGRVVVICALVAIVASAYPVGELPLAALGPQRDEFVRNMTDTCFKKQRPAPAGNSTLSGAQLRKFCGCVAAALAGQTRREDIEYQAKNKAFSPAMTSRITQAGRSCAQDMLK
ncbi:MAG TPA: hypothetical protein VGG01_14765 [Xanthobacteraceae bacterium]